jgi:DNA-binding NarL/FixJ family response regulator
VLELDLLDLSGFEVLVQLVPIAHHPEIAVIVLTHLPNTVLLDLALKNGALAALYKSRTSGDMLDKTIMKAISRVQRDSKKTQRLETGRPRPR